MDFSDPLINLGHVTLRPNLVAADFGSGSGMYALALAEELRNDGGKVYAIEVQKGLAEMVKHEAAKQRLSNLTAVWGDLEGSRGSTLAPSSVDLVIISNMLFQSDSKEAVMAEAFKILRPGGELLLIDWEDSFGNLGPAPMHVITKVTAEALLKHQGFRIKETFEAGAHHYGFVAIK